MRLISEIIVHCTATRANWWPNSKTSAKVAEIRKWHTRDRGWSDLGYHYLIDRDGTIAKGRPLEKAGAHTKGRNAKSIGISLFGGHGSTENDNFHDNFTPEQDRALRKLIAELRRQFPGISKVSGHNEYAAKACPGFRVDRWMQGQPSARSTPMQSKTNVAAAVAATATAAGAVVPKDGLNITFVLAGIALAAVAFIVLDRMRKWRKGDR